MGIRFTEKSKKCIRLYKILIGLSVIDWQDRDFELLMELSGSRP